MATNKSGVNGDSLEVQSATVKDLLDAGAIETVEATVTGETVIEATRESSTTTITSGNYANLFDAKNKDNRDEFNASNQFVPDETGYYIIDAQYAIGGATVDGDQIQLRLRDVDSGTDVAGNIESQSTKSIHVDGYTFVEELTAGTTYEVQITNFDNTFDIVDKDTQGTILRSLVG